MSPHHFSTPTVTYLGGAHAENQAPSAIPPKTAGPAAPQAPRPRV